MIAEPTPCPLCGSSSVTTKVDAIKMRSGDVEVHYATCDECGGEVNPDGDNFFIVDIEREVGRADLDREGA